MIDLGSLAQTYGYPVVILGTMLQGEAVLLVFGFLAHQGYLSPWILILVAAVAAMFGDTTYFFIGRHYGERFLAHFPRGIRSPLHMARNLAEHHPNKVLLFMRFFFGMRILMPVVCGMSSIKTNRFFRYNVPTAFVWAGIFVGAGYLFGTAARKVVRDIENAELFLILGLFVAAYLYHFIGRKIQERRSRNNMKDTV